MLSAERARLASSGPQDRESIRARIRVALDLAIGNSLAQAQIALAQLEPALDSGDHEIRARYLVARAIMHLKQRSIGDAFESFGLALGAARAHGDPALIAGVLTNYGTAAVQDGSVEVAIACLEERRALSRDSDRSSIGLLGLAEALFVAGRLRPAAPLLHAVYVSYAGTVTLLGAAAVGIPTGIMLCDETLLTLSYNPALLDLGFARGEQWLLGPLVEAFCSLYEREDRRDEHDALLARALQSLASLDNSLLLAIRVARLGNAGDVARIGRLVSQQCPAESSDFHHAYTDVFESFLAARRRAALSSKELGLRAAQTFARAGRPFMRALALDAAGLGADARTVRRECGALVDDLGPRWIGSPLPQQRRRGSEHLTAREIQVARFAAGGSTNRAIAERLGLSERTVHRHCESIFAKLGIHSRWQLPAALAEPE